MSDPLGLKNPPSEKSGGNSPGQNEQRYWMNQINSALKREKSYRTRARRALEVYEADEDKDCSPFNILYSNTETLLPALYNDTPRPVVKRRWKEPNPAAKIGAEALSRGLAYTLDNPSSGYESLGTILEDVVLSALVPGRGACRLFYDADIQDYGGVTNEKDTKDGDDEEVGDLDGEDSKTSEEPPAGQEKALLAEAQAPGAAPKVKAEFVCARLQKWDQFCFGFAKRWDGVPWIAYGSDMTKKDVEKSFGKKWAKKLNFSSETSQDREKKENKDENEQRPENTCRIWEIWHKSARKIIFLAENYIQGIVKREDDPLQLTGFYNMPEPLHFGRKLSSLIPTPLYEYYRKQAEELNHLTQRIDAVTDAIKVRGFYDGGLGKMAQLMQQPDNTLMPAEGAQQFKDGAKLQDLIWLMPLQELVGVLQTLTQEREGVKRVIYEITGIADILRGSSVASETATAQNIKDKWGTLRLKKMQKRVQRYVRECFRMIAEIQGNHFTEETFAQMTQLPVMTGQQKQQMQQEFEALQAQQQQQQAMQPPAQAPQGSPSSGGQPGAGEGGGPGGPSAGGQPPPPDPNQQKLQQMEQQLSQPSWEDVLKLLKNDLVSGYLIDVETNSTVDPEAVEDREAFAEMMNGMAQAMQQYVPAVQQGVMPMPVFKSLLKGVSRRYNVGTEFEDAVDAMPDQLPPPPPDPKMEVMKIEAEGKKAEQQAKQQELQQKGQLAQQETQNQIQLMQAKLEVEKAEIAIKKEELKLKEMELQLKQKEMMAKQQDHEANVQRQRELAQVKHDGMLSVAKAKTMAAMMQAGGGMGGPPEGAQGADLPVQM